MSVYALSNPLDIHPFNTANYWCNTCGHIWYTSNGLCHLCQDKQSRPASIRPKLTKCSAPEPRLCPDQNCQEEQTNEA